MVIKLTKRSCFYILLSILLLLLAIRYSFQVEIPILTAIVIIMAMFGNRNEIVAVAMSCIPLHNAVDFYVAIVACAGILIIKNSSRSRIGFPVILVAFMIVWELLHCFAFEWTPIMLLVSLAPLILIGVYLSLDLHGINYAFVVRIMAFIAAYMGVLQIAICVFHADGNLFQIFAILGRLGSISEEDTLVGGAINPNTIGIINVLCMTGLLQIRLTDLKKKTDRVLFFVLLILGMLTQSRTFLVCLLIMLILVLVNQKADLRKIIRMFGSSLLVGLLMIIVMNVMFPQVLANFIKRFQVEDITTGRGHIMSQYHKYITDNLDVMFFGIGLSDYDEKVTSIYNISIHTSHNSIQEIVVAWGIPGLLMIALLIFMMIHESTKHGGRKILLNFIPLVIILAKSMAGQMLTSGYTMLALVFAYLSLCQDFSGIKKLDEMSL